MSLLPQVLRALKKWNKMGSYGDERVALHAAGRCNMSKKGYVFHIIKRRSSIPTLFMWEDYNHRIISAS